MSVKISKKTVKALALVEAGASVHQAAKVEGVAPSTLYRAMQRGEADTPEVVDQAKLVKAREEGRKEGEARVAEISRNGQLILEKLQKSEAKIGTLQKLANSDYVKKEIALLEAEKIRLSKENQAAQARLQKLQRQVEREEERIVELVKKRKNLEAEAASVKQKAIWAARKQVLGEPVE